MRKAREGARMTAREIRERITDRVWRIRMEEIGRTVAMETFTGRVVTPMDLKPEDVCIEDIARSLAMQCRYQGHTSSFYSVAQHSVIVARVAFMRTNADPDTALLGLLHDAAEAYAPGGDVIWPWGKSRLAFIDKESLWGLENIEAMIRGRILEAYGLTDGMWNRETMVKEIDREVVGLEARYLMRSEGKGWGNIRPSIVEAEVPGDIVMQFDGAWRWEQAEEEFLDSYEYFEMRRKVKRAEEGIANCDPHTAEILREEAHEAAVGYQEYRGKHRRAGRPTWP